MRDLSAPPDLTPEELRRHRDLAAQIETYVQPYLARNPRAKSAVDALFPSISSEDESCDGNVSSSAAHHVWDHLAFRSFDCVDGGLTAVARVFEKHGYTFRGSLTFPEKKVDAAWYAPPDARWAKDKRGDPIFPRLFVSHLRVADLTDEKAKAVIIKRVTESGSRRSGSSCGDDELVNEHASFGDAVAERGGVPWRDAEMTLDEYELVSNASEYAAWTLINGHALNHVAVPVHRLFVDEEKPKQEELLKPPRRRFASLETCLDFLKAPPLSLPLSNAGGGEVKVSPDGGLRQASTVADDVELEFVRGGEEGEEDENIAKTKTLVPASYVEFVDRLPMARLRDSTVSSSDEDSLSGPHGHYVPERMLRDGFETANADAIFESTFSAQRRDASNVKH